MSFNFGIKSIYAKEQKIGSSYVRGTGNVLPFERSEELTTRMINVEGGSRKEYQTGLDPNRVDLLNYLNTAQKAEYKKLLTDYIPTLEKAFGGKKTIESTNQFFWGENGRNKIVLNNLTEDTIFSMNDPEHVLIYFNILGGGYSSLIAPSKEIAESSNLSHYLVHEDDYIDDVAQDYASKGKAYTLMNELAEAEGEGLYYLAWCLQPETTGFAAYNKSYSKQELIKYNSMYIEALLNKNKKKNCPKAFIDYAQRFKDGGLTRISVMTEAYINAGLYFTILSKDKEQKIINNKGSVLGNDIKEVLNTISKPKMAGDLADLRDAVEKRWNA